MEDFFTEGDGLGPLRWRTSRNNGNGKKDTGSRGSIGIRNVVVMSVLQSQAAQVRGQDSDRTRRAIESHRYPVQGVCGGQCSDRAEI